MRAAVTLTLAALVVTQTASQSQNDASLEDKVMSYMWSLYINPNKNLLEYLGMNLIKYGYMYSNCELPQDMRSESEQVRTLNNIFRWKNDLDMQYHFGFFYEYYILPEGDDDASVLWYCFIKFFQEYEIYNPLAGFYTINQIRGCPIQGKMCERSLPGRPIDLKFTKTQCKKIHLYIREMASRLYKPVGILIPFTIPFDYYTIAIYLLRKFPVSDKDTGYVNREEKLFQLEVYLKGALQVDKEECIEQYSMFLAYRKKKEALLEADLKEASDEPTRKVREEKLNFHKTVTDMMVKGWEEVNK